MKIRDVLSWLDALAPFESAEDFDNVGLLMGDENAAVRGVTFGMDVTEALVDEALSHGDGLIVTHHPFIFHALKRIDYTGPQGRALLKIARGGLGVIAAHTNWDKAPGGVGDSLAAALGLSDVSAPDEYIRLGTLPAPLSPGELGALIRHALHIDARCYPASDSPISRVAVAGGAYGEGYALAVSSGAQAFVVGEVRHHELLDACARGLTVYDAGHFPTELPGVMSLYERFLADATRAGWPVKTHLHFQPPYAGAFLAP